MIKGYILQLKTKPKAEGVKFSYNLYGRVISRTYRNRKQQWYSKGMLHDTLFCKIHKGRIFVEDIASIDFNILNNYGKVSIVEEGEIDETKYKLTTGKEYFENFFKEKGVKLNVTKKNN